MKEIFISYSKDQEAKAMQLADDLNLDFKDWKIDIDEPDIRRARRPFVENQIKRCDHFLVYVSKEGYETDEIAREEIAIALEASKEKEDDLTQFIIPIRTDECIPRRMGLSGFRAIDYTDRKQTKKELYRILKKSVFIQNALNLSGTKTILDNPALRAVAYGLAANILYDGLKLAAAYLGLMDEDEAIPEYNIKCIPTPLPGPGDSFEFLDPDSDDEEECWLKEYCDKKRWDYIAFYFDKERALIGHTGDPQRVNGDEPDELEDLPDGVLIILVALGKAEDILPAKEKLEEGKALDKTNSDMFWLMYG